MPPETTPRAEPIVVFPRSQVLQLKFLAAFALIATLGLWINLTYYAWFPGQFGWKYPATTFVTPGVSRFSDFYDMVELDQTRDPYNLDHRPAPVAPRAQKSAYPPFIHLMFWGFSQADINYSGKSSAEDHKAMDWAIWLAIAIPVVGFPALALAWLRPQLPWVSLLLLIAAFDLSYPMIFAIDRGNLELIVVVLITLFGWWNVDVDPRRRQLAVVALGAAIAMKLYPVIFLLVFLKQGRWRAAIGSVLVALGLTLVSFALLRRGLFANITGFVETFRSFSQQITTDVRWGTHFSSSLFALITLTLRIFCDAPKAAAAFMVHHAPVLFGFSAVMTAFYAFRPLTFGRLFTAACCLAILVTPESPDYKLLLLFPATVAIIAEGGGSRVFNLIFVSAMGLLLVPKQVVDLLDDISLSSVINPVLVLALLFLVIFSAPPQGSATFGFPSLRAGRGRG